MTLALVLVMSDITVAFVELVEFVEFVEFVEPQT